MKLAARERLKLRGASIRDGARPSRVVTSRIGDGGTARKSDPEPRRGSGSLPIPAGRPGIETLVLLAREHSVLSQKDAEKLAKLASKSTVSRSSLIKEAVRLENGREITMDLLDRSAPSAKTRKSDDPVLLIRRLLSDQVQPRGDYCQALIFPSAGGK